MNRRGFFGALAALAVAPLAWRRQSYSVIVLEAGRAYSVEDVKRLSDCARPGGVILTSSKFPPHIIDRYRFYSNVGQFGRSFVVGK